MGWYSILCCRAPVDAANADRMRHEIEIQYVYTRVPCMQRFSKQFSISLSSIWIFEDCSRVRVHVVADCGNNNGVALISRLQPRYCCRNYASKIHLLPALTNFRQTWFPGFRKYLHGSAAVIPASRRFTASPPLLPVRPSPQPWKISRDYDFFQVPSKRDLEKIRFLRLTEESREQVRPIRLRRAGNRCYFSPVSFYRRFRGKAWFVTRICS